MIRNGRSPVEALKQEFRRRLEENRATLLRTLARTDEEAAASGSELRGFSEVAAEESERNLLTQLGGKERRELDDISDALARLETGTYGRCERCGHPMALARLRAVPAARYCLTCQQKQEATR